MKCIACEHRWQPEDIERPGRCPECGQSSSVTQRCDGCPVTEVEYQRATTPTGRLLNRVLEHEFDAKHYNVDPGAISVEIREGLKVLEQERNKWEQETRERKQQEYEDRQRVRELQQRQARGGGGF